MRRTTRRSLTLAGATATTVALLVGCGAPEARQPTGTGGADAAGEAPVRPSEPVTLNVIDVAGNLALTRPAIEKFAAENKDLVRRVTFTKATAPELAGKIKAQQDAGRVDIDLVLTGTDGLAAAAEQGLVEQLLPRYADRFPGVPGEYLPTAAKMQEQAAGNGLVVSYYPSGPLLEHNPKVTPPRTAQELLAWAKANPGRFMYARPANSGPGRTWMMGLPYLLGDSDPKDPINGWDKTWAYLKELGRYIDYYPSGTTPTMKELAEGSRDIVVTTTGWDINPRVLGTVPADFTVSTLEGFHWVADAHFMLMPRGLAGGRKEVALQLMSYLLTPPAQAFAYDQGYFYPGPAIRGVTLDMAPEASRTALARFGRPEYDKLIAEVPTETPLEPEQLVAAFDKWDREVGGGKVKP